MLRTLFLSSLCVFTFSLLGCGRQTGPIQASESELEAFRIQQEKDQAEVLATIPTTDPNFAP
jgi:hypothetical protein